LWRINKFHKADGTLESTTVLERTSITLAEPPAALFEPDHSWTEEAPSARFRKKLDVIAPAMPAAEKARQIAKLERLDRNYSSAKKQ